MKRLHLLEIHEQAWCPSAVRNGATDCLEMIATFLQQYRNVAPLLATALRQSHAQRIVDLCSGGAGPWRSLSTHLQRHLGGAQMDVLLTDLYPSWHSTHHDPDADQKLRTKPTGRARIIFVPFSVDATQVSPSLPGFRTLFTAFHHFEPATARAILQSAIDDGQGIAIFEQTRRHPLALPVMLLLPLLAFLLTPFIRPWRPSRTFWTYVIPAIPLVLCIDGLVSCLRTYEPDELLALASGLRGPAYHWQAGRVASPLSPLGVTYLVGTPDTAALPPAAQAEHHS
jgi:hypothetical protein